MELSEIKELFKNDGYLGLSGIEILSVDNEKAVVGAKILPHHLNMNGVVQGGMLFTLADAAFSVISNYLHPGTVTLSGNITYITAANTDYVTAEAVETIHRRHNNVVQVVIKDRAGDIICSATINGFIKNI